MEEEEDDESNKDAPGDPDAVDRQPPPAGKDEF